jgi:hypothetical protein
VAAQGKVDFAQYAQGQAGIADHHHRVEVMGAGLQGFAFQGG